MTEPLKLQWTQIQERRTQEQQASNLLDDKRSKAPYNFVSLNADVMAYPANAPGLVDHSRFAEDTYSGTITATIKTRSPLFVGSKSGEFFAPQGQPVIPGSTLRGLLRQMVTVLSYGKFTQFDRKRRLFTRPMADLDAEFRKWYYDQLTNPDAEDSAQKYTAAAGYLYKQGHDYYIRPAVEDGAGKSLAIVKKEDVQKILGYRLEDFSYAADPQGNGFYISSGPMQTKNPRTKAPTPKSRDWHVFAPDFTAEPVRVPRESIEDYRKDTREARSARLSDAKRLDLLDWLKNGCKGVKFSEGIPVFYTVRENGYVSFGHTGMFRIAYSKKVGDHVASEHTRSDRIDLAEHLFGRIDAAAGQNERPAFAGSVFIGDAPVTGNCQFLDARDVLLAGPRLTSFQHYLVQPRSEKDGKRHWDSDSLIRGTKFYWNQPVRDASTGNGNRNMLTTLTPLAPDTEFDFCLRFENLTAVELGALLTAIRLKGELDHRLGMAKPLGYGAFKFKKPQVSLIQPHTRYQSLLAEDQLNEGMEKKKFDFQEQMMNEFQTEVFEHVGDNEKQGAENYWQLKRMRQLAAILSNDPNRATKDELTYFEEPKMFKDRKLLPDPEEVEKIIKAKFQTEHTTDPKKLLRQKGINL